jgi:hypothetical protein
MKAPTSSLLRKQKANEQNEQQSPPKKKKKKPEGRCVFLGVSSPPSFSTNTTTTRSPRSTQPTYAHQHCAHHGADTRRRRRRKWRRRCCLCLRGGQARGGSLGRRCGMAVGEAERFRVEGEVHGHRPGPRGAGRVGTFHHLILLAVQLVSRLGAIAPVRPSLFAVKTRFE